MDKRKAIGIVMQGVKYLCVAIVSIVAGAMIASNSYEEKLQDKQEYAQNAYNLGKAEYLGLEKLPPEEIDAFQEKIWKIMNSELSLQEQEKAMDEIFLILQKYSDVILPTEEQ